MDIIDGTDTRTRIILGFTRAEFDDLCEQLASRLMTTGEAGKILRFRSCLTDEQTFNATVGTPPTAGAGLTTEQLLQRITDLERDRRVAEDELSKWRRGAANRSVETLDLEERPPAR